MSLDIDSQIQNLPKEKLEEFAKEYFDDCINDRLWCRIHGIDYVSPDYKKAKEILFNEKYARYIPA